MRGFDHISLQGTPSVALFAENECLLTALVCKGLRDMLPPSCLDAFHLRLSHWLLCHCVLINGLQVNPIALQSHLCRHIREHAFQGS